MLSSSYWGPSLIYMYMHFIFFPFIFISWIMSMYDKNHYNIVISLQLIHAL